MRLLVLLCIMALSTNIAFAQECQKVCDKKNKYVQSGDLIEATLFHDNGVVAQTGFYNQENELTGEWVSFDENGVKTAVAQYDNGNKVGTWVFFEGDVKREVVYENFKIAQVNTWQMKDSRVVTNK